jgi:hypothetical protein
VKKSTTHVPLDKETERYTVHSRGEIGNFTTAIHDTKTKKETILWSAVDGNRHWFPWTGVDAHALCDWLNERARGYPPLTTLTKYSKGRSW